MHKIFRSTLHTNAHYLLKISICFKTLPDNNKNVKLCVALWLPITPVCTKGINHLVLPFFVPHFSTSSSLPVRQWLFFSLCLLSRRWDTNSVLGQSVRTHAVIRSDPVGFLAVMHRIHNEFVLFSVHSFVNNTKAKLLHAISIHQNTGPGYSEPGKSNYSASQSSTWNISTALLFSLMLDISKHSQPVMILPLHLALVQSRPEYCVQLWAPQYKMGVEAKLVKGQEGMCCEERPRSLGVPIQKRRRLQGGFTVPSSSLRREVPREVLVSAPWDQWPDAWRWHGAGPGESQPGHEGKFMCHEGGQTLGQAA